MTIYAPTERLVIYQINDYEVRKKAPPENSDDAS
jgi:hypothetical protein